MTDRPERIGYVGTDGGLRLAAGLSWRAVATDPTWRIGATGLALVHAEGGSAEEGRYARTQDMAAEGASSLLLALARCLTEAGDGGPLAEGGDWLFVARTDPDSAHPEGRHWLAQASVSVTGDATVTAVPLARPEECHDSFDGLMQAVTEISSVWIVAGLAVMDTDPFADRVTEALVAAGVFDAARIRRVSPRADGLPVFTRFRRMPVATVAVAMSAAGAALVAALLLPGLLSSLMAAAPPPPVQLARATVADGAFRSACSGSLSDWWPRVVGWRTRSSGCALAGHVPARIGIAPPRISPAEPGAAMLSWRRLELEDSANPVLAAGAAERVLADWPHGYIREARAVTLWRPFTLPLVAESPPEHAPEDVPSARLRKLWADTPGAVREGQGGFTVTAPGAPDDLLARASRVPDLAPVLLDVPETGPATMVLRPPQSRNLPAALLAGPRAATVNERNGP